MMESLNKFFRLGKVVMVLLLFSSCKNENNSNNEIAVKDEGIFLAFSKGGKQILSYQTTGALPREGIDSIFLRGNHKSNFRFPQPMRLHPSEPFFCYTPSQLGKWLVSEENPYKAKYIVYDGNPDIELVEKIWEEYNQ